METINTETIIAPPVFIDARTDHALRVALETGKDHPAIVRRIALAVGLEAWAGLDVTQTPEAIAARYHVDVSAVAECKKATESLHKQLVELFGTEFYFESMGFERGIAAAIWPDLSECC